MSDGSLKGQLHRCSINTATLGHRSPINKVVERVAASGFGWIAPWRRDIEGVDLRQLRRQIDDAGLRVSSLCRSTYFPADDAQGAANAIQDNRLALDAAAALGAKCFVLVVGGLAPRSTSLDNARAQVVDGIGALLDHARNCGVPLALEPLHPMYAADRSCVSTLQQGLDICEAVAPLDSTHLGIAVDIYHCWWDPNVFDQIVRAGAAGRIQGFHLSDWLRETKDLLLDRGMMGDGVVELARLRHAVEAAGYQGPYEVEIFSRDNWWRQDEDLVLETCAERLQSFC